MINVGTRWFCDHSPMSSRRPLPSSDIVGQLAGSLSAGQSLEQLVRPLLELLHAVTGLDSTYLTRIDAAQGVQRVLYAHNAGTLQMPEQLSVPWADTLCRRSLEQGRTFTDQVDTLWGDSDAARALGIVSYLSTPVRSASGELIGTLCAASTERVDLAAGVEHVLEMFSHLISRQIEREQLIEELRIAQQALRLSADTDALTGLPNRRALLNELDRRLVQHAQAGTPLLVAFIDLDGFKRINDTWGHTAGDRFLAAIGAALRRGQRPEDYCARLGGDEFVTLTSLGHEHADLDQVEQSVEMRLQAVTCGCFNLGQGIVIDYHGPSIGLIRVEGPMTATAVLTQADAAMYRSKQARQAARNR
jgi:diguanylate cyclase